MKPNWRRMWKATEWTLATTGALVLGISFAHAALLWELLCLVGYFAAIWYFWYGLVPLTSTRTVRRRFKRARNRSGATRDTANLPSRRRPAKRDPLPQHFVGAPTSRAKRVVEEFIDGIPASRFTKLDPSRFIQ